MSVASRAARGMALLIVCGASAAGCMPRCGSYSALTGLEKVVGQDVYDYDRDDLFETCGAGFGGFGSFAIDGGSLGTLVLLPDHRNMAIDTHIATDLYYHVLFDNQSLVVGGELTSLGGEAGIYAILFAELTRGRVEVLDSRDPDPECTPFRQQEYKLRWELEYGDLSLGNNYYTAEGEDWVGLSLPMSSTDPGC